MKNEFNDHFYINSTPFILSTPAFNWHILLDLKYNQTNVRALSQVQYNTDLSTIECTQNSLRSEIIVRYLKQCLKMLIWFSDWFMY